MAVIYPQVPQYPLAPTATGFLRPDDPPDTEVVTDRGDALEMAHCAMNANSIDLTNYGKRRATTSLQAVATRRDNGK